jgi:antitoxin component YwqK of YwqJK toxin-antitoxin module
MASFGFRLLKSRWAWGVTIAGGLAVVALWALLQQRAAEEGDSVSPVASRPDKDLQHEDVHDDPWDFVYDELFGYGTLGLFDPPLVVNKDAIVSPQPRVKETSTPVQIDGQPGTLSQGWYANGKPEHEEHWLGSKKHGREVWWNDEGQRTSEAHWKDGYLHGLHTSWYDDGQILEQAHYDRYRLHGTQKTWYRNGQLRKQSEYQNGLREGKFVAWHRNGIKLCEATFAEDFLDGAWQKWDADGKLLKWVEYRKGEVVGQLRSRRQQQFTYPGSLGARDFAFLLSQGGGWHGYNTLRVSASGKCEFTYLFWSWRVATNADAGPHLKAGDIYQTSTWRKAVFQLTDEMQRQLREALQTADLFALNDQYIDEKVHDGTQWIIGLRAAGKAKRIYCSNSFPECLRKLSRTLRDQIMVAHQVELITATRCEGGELQSGKAWLAGLGCH